MRGFIGLTVHLTESLEQREALKKILNPKQGRGYRLSLVIRYF